MLGNSFKNIFHWSLYGLYPHTLFPLISGMSIPSIPSIQERNEDIFDRIHETCYYKTVKRQFSIIVRPRPSPFAAALCASVSFALPNLQKYIVIGEKDSIHLRQIGG